MTQKLIATYRKFRTVGGMTAKYALSSAKTYLRFSELEYLGYVRIRVESDDAADVSFMSPKEREAWDGEAFGTISEYRLPMPEGFEYSHDDAGWQVADSCWGHIGYRDVSDPFENWYVVDEMAEALEQFDADAERLANLIESEGHGMLRKLLPAYAR